MRIVCASGYFNPLHKGHIQYLQKAKALGDILMVIINNDWQVKLKGSVPFQNESERMEIVESLRCVDAVYLSVDNDLSICKSLEEIQPDILANGGDRTEENIPEVEVCRRLGIKMVFGLGEKIQSSSALKEGLTNNFRRGIKEA